MNNNNNLDVNALLNMLSKMDKKDLEKGLNKAKQMLNSNDKNNIINNLKDMK